jgi:AraC-like DNA-binding protein
LAISTHIVRPDPTLTDFVDSFWMLQNSSDQYKEIIVLPDGRVDLFLSYSNDQPFSIKLLGLGIHPISTKIAPGTLMFSISFNPIATEYILKKNISSILDQAEQLGQTFWNFSQRDTNSFEEFCKKASAAVTERLPKELDNRKKRLFELIFSSKGALSIQDLSDKVYWSSRQINRYFNNQFGLSLKSYCSIIRFRASLHYLKEGKLFPEENFSDQPHFIKEVKKLAGVSPKKLAQNQNGRFIQFFALPRK